MKIVRTFEVEYDAELGVDWLCLGNLQLCLLGATFLGPGLVERIEEVAVREVNEDVQRYVCVQRGPK